MVIAVISPNQEAQDVIVGALERSGNIDTVWSLVAYPNPSQLKDLPQDPDGCVIFLDGSSREAAAAIAAEAQASHPSIRVVGMVGGADAPRDFAGLTKFGVRDVVGLPPGAHEVLQVLAKVPTANDLLPDLLADDGSGGKIFVFLPAKPGAGASTLAVHCSAAAARLAAQRTLLADFDFRLGMTSFLLKLSGMYSVLDALNEGGRDQVRWDRLVNRLGKLDILGSAPQQFNDLDAERGAALLLNRARKEYKTIVVDLPGEMRDYEIDTMRRARECFLVCTPDIGVMHMAQRKAEQLRSHDLEKKTSVIMNQSGGMGFMSAREVESILQLPVRFSVPKAEKEIAEATKAAAALEGRGPAATQIENIARCFLPQEMQPKEQPASRRFLEFFSPRGSGKGGER